MTRNARFWVWSLNGGWVKLTLLPGQSLTHWTGGDTDEGYSYSAETYTHDDDRVICTQTTDSRDCDGRLDSARESACLLSELRARDMGDVDECGQWQADEFVACPENSGIFAPRWHKVSACQRDYAAEAAGY